jgi:hypothetical protein
MWFSSATLVAIVVVPGALAQDVVQFQISKYLPTLRIGTKTPSLHRRDALTQALVNNITGGGYYVDVTVGTPPQKVSMVLDTGSSDAWVVSYKAPLCTNAKLQQVYGDSCSATYNPSLSSTYKLVKTAGFNISYVDGVGATGDFVSDDFNIADKSIKSLQIGYATATVRGTGVLGVGFPANEASLFPYPNIIDQLFSQNLIKSKAYSLWLNDRRSSTGSILFGGVDTQKFFGPLHVLPIQPTDGNGTYSALAVSMTSLNTTYSNGSVTATTVPSTPGVDAVLDSGTTLSYIPGDVAKPLFKQFGAVTDYRLTGLTYIDCKYLTTEPDLTISFGFGLGNSSVSIVVPVQELVLDVLSNYDEIYTLKNLPFKNVCLFGIQTTDGLPTSALNIDPNNSTSPELAILGDTFLRSAYVVYDLDHKQIGIAQANLNSTTANVQELASTNNTTGLPTTLTGQPFPTKTAATKTGSPTGNSGGGGSTTSTGNAQPPSSTSSGAGALLPSDSTSGLAIAAMFALLGGAFFVL